ncbi:MAG: sensor histidine kinase [Firmicutes bacterium]|nr:sensor histidine kinase [Bacillota bacterium]
MKGTAPPSKPLSKYRTAFFAFVVVVFAAYLPAIGSPRWPFLVFLGLVYTVFGIAGATPLCTRSWPARTLYFLIEILLGTGIVAISGGSAFLVMMPLPALAAIFLSRTGLVLVSALVIAGETAVHLWHYGPGAAVDSLTTIVPAVVFVAAFGLVAGKEYRVREDAERLAGELSAANLKLRQYALQAEELAAAEERNRIAREIHDTLGHYLTAIHVQISAAKAVLREDGERALTALERVQKLTEESLAEVRHAVAALREKPMEGKQLTAAVAELVEESRAAGIATALEILGMPRKLAPLLEMVVYRVVQEGLTNVRKHAAAASARVLLDFTNESSVRVSIQDDGRGALPGATDGFGLTGLRERVQCCGGRFATTSAPGKGFTIEAEVPG